MKSETATMSYRLTPMQQGMLVHARQASRVGVDIEQILCAMPEGVDSAAFERAWQWAVKRHEILRTGFRWEGREEPCQEVHADAPLRLEEQDWRGLAPEQRAEQLEALLRAERFRGFDLTTPPLMRLVLVRLAEHESEWIWTFHHLLVDGQAVVQLLKEVFACYEALVEGRRMALEPPRRYQDFVDWLGQRDWSRAETFWRHALDGLVAPTRWPAEPPSAAAPGAPWVGQHRVQEFFLTEPTTAALASMAHRHDLTLNTVVQGAWAIVLSHYTGAEDVVFGAVRAGRRSTVPGAESIVGLCINTVPVRVKVAFEQPVLPWLRELRREWLAMREFEHLPLVNIQACSQVPRGQSLFDTLFNFQDPSWEAALRAQGGKWERRRFDIRSQPSYPLAVDAYGGPNLRVKIWYDRNRFSEGAMTRLLGHFRTLLAGMAADPERPLGALPWLTKAERHQLLIEWNETEAEFASDQCVLERFEAQAQSTAKALAVADQFYQLSYGELNQRAEQVAGRLLALGLRQGGWVGVCLERSVEMVVALLGIWKAGGAYVPLDPAHPRERLQAMLEDAQVHALVARQYLLGLIRPLKDTPILELDRLAGAPGAVTAPRRRPRPEDLAYVIYTSGSTGTPKGVPVEHRSLMNLVCWHQQSYGITPRDRATQLAAPGFDAAVWELWPHLAAGASVHIPAEPIRLAPSKLLAWLAERQITLSFVPTPLLEAMFDETWPRNLALRFLLTGGDTLHRLPPKALPCPLVNHYGPTECTVVATSKLVTAGASSLGPPPIGRPIANTQAFILDSRQQLVPVGVAGELYLGGVGLARGYHRRPELAAERFIAHPFSADKAARLYRTGDRVRYLANGDIEFLGRVDEQVKIRGNRVELGEIESALLGHPEVRQAVVTAREDAGQQKQLVAYVVGTSAAAAATGELMEFLRRKLPEYMVPSTIVRVAALPLSPNGKVDRQALPAPDGQANLAGAYVPPRTPTEETLARIWRAVLRRDRVGIHDRFFDLGGHSLLATQVIARARQALGVEMPVSWLFETPTVAELARRLEELRHEPPHWPPPPSASSSSSGGILLSFAQERLWFFEQLQPGQVFNNIPLRLHLEGELDTRALESAFGEILRRHQSLRTTLARVDGRPVASVSPSHAFCIPMQDLGPLEADHRSRAAQRLAQEEARRPFNPGESPLVRAQLVRLGPQDHELVVTMHHVASDGWSVGILYRELAALYAAFTEGRPSPLADPPLQYPVFARWQREWLQGEVLDKQLAFWKQRLGGPLPVLELPTDRPRPAVQGYHGATHYFALPKPLAAALRELSRREDATLFMVLLAAFQTLLSRYSGQEDILVGSPIAGRRWVETEDLIGCFLNTLVFRGDLAGDPTFREFLGRVRQDALAAYAHQDLPFEKLVEAVQPERDLSRAPVFQVMFILQNEPLPPLQLAGLKLTPRPVDSGTAKFDLTLSLEETDGGLDGSAEFNADLLEPATVSRMMVHFQTLLESITTDPNQRLSKLAVLTETEHELICDKWNSTCRDYPADRRIHQLIEAQAGRTPGRIAAAYQGEQWTYAELNRRAEELAARLRAWGVAAETRVALCADRSLEMLAGLLGILKAGACYVPLDASYPRERLAFMLKDSAAAIVLTQENQCARFQALSPDLPLICLDTQTTVAPGGNVTEIQAPAPRWPKLPSHRSSDAARDPLAYIIYTSGSTGKPKGVMVTHRNVVNFFAGMDRLLGTNPGVWLAVTNITFDISILELLWPLTHGYKVVIHPDLRGTATPVASPRTSARPLEFSVCVCAGQPEFPPAGRYRMQLAGAEFAQQHGFAVTWAPDLPFVAAAVLGRPTGGRQEPSGVMAVTVEAFRAAGQSGANVLTPLLGQSFAELAENIRRYRQARSSRPAAGAGKVVVVAHTFMEESMERAREKARAPMVRILTQSVGALKKLAPNLCAEVDFKNLAETDLETLANYAFERYGEYCGLIGTPRTCLAQVERLRALGVDEVACLIDFGVQDQAVLVGLPYLGQLRQLANESFEQEELSCSIPEEVIRQGATHLQFTPSLGQALVSDPGWPGAAQNLRKLLVGGEVLPPTLAEKLSLGGDLYNLYGPTETTIWSCAHRVDPGQNPIPIGRPLTNTRVYVLDRHREMVPVGVPGDLYIGGDGVARGYLNQRQLTAENFIPDSFRPGAGRRLYRTGDRVRYRADGTLEFLGRQDQQVKVRGHRIELEEIESVLSQHPAVQQGVVTVVERQAHNPRVAGYVVRLKGQDVSGPDLKRYLSDRLPDPMIPSTLIFLDHLPLTANGKVDRRALPPPDESAEASTTAFAPPLTELEQRLAAIWRELLGTDHVGVHDNFFDLGGHSLLVVRLQARLRAELNLDLPIVKLFECPNIRSLTQALGERPARTSLSQVRARAQRRAGGAAVQAREGSTA